MVGKDLSRLLDFIASDLRSVGGGLQPQATPTDITQLRQDTESKLEASLPAEYEEFLRITNGLSWGGVAIYGTSPAGLVGFSDRVLSGLCESNLTYRASSPKFRNYLVFGDDGETLFAMNLVEPNFEIVTAFFSSLSTFPTFEQMLFFVLNEQM